MRALALVSTLLLGLVSAGSAHAAALGIQITAILLPRAGDPLGIGGADFVFRAEFPHNATWQAFSGNPLFLTLPTAAHSITISNASNTAFNDTFIIPGELGLFPDFTPGGSPAPDTFFTAAGPDFTINASTFRIELDNLPDPSLGDPLTALFLGSYTMGTLREILMGDPGGNFYDFEDFAIGVFEIDGAPKVPLPAGLPLLLTGLVLLGWRGRRQT
ncbi:MAG: hypothetical protein AAF371_17505 [Pseudomonadota bacterium]